MWMVCQCGRKPFLSILIVLFLVGTVFICLKTNNIEEKIKLSNLKILIGIMLRRKLVNLLTSIKVIVRMGEAVVTSFDLSIYDHFLIFQKNLFFKKFRVYDKILFLWDGKAIAKSQKVLKNCHIYSILFQEFKRIFKNQNKEKIL